MKPSPTWKTEPAQLFFSPDNAACIDGDIAEKDGKFYLFFKTEDRLPGIKLRHRINSPEVM